MTRIHPGHIAWAIEQPLLRAGGADEPSVSIEELRPADQADTDKRQRFAAQANLILAFVECSDELRPKLRNAIIDAMLWAQTQP